MPAFVGVPVIAPVFLSTFATDFFELDHFMRYPVESWNRIRSIFYDLWGKCAPNAAHLAIAALEKDYDVTVITQNVDNLHERAGSTRVLHLHGEATKVRPENGEYDRTYSEKEVIDVGYEPVNLGDLAPNGSQLRPHIVFFGEAVPNIEKAIDIVSEADVMLIVGTSLNVYPAAGLYRYAKNGVPVYLIDPEDVAIYDPKITHIREVATKGMEVFINKLKECIF